MSGSRTGILEILRPLLHRASLTRSETQLYKYVWPAMTLAFFISIILVIMLSLSTTSTNAIIQYGQDLPSVGLMSAEDVPRISVRSLTTTMHDLDGVMSDKVSVEADGNAEVHVSINGQEIPISNSEATFEVPAQENNQSTVRVTIHQESGTTTGTISGVDQNTSSSTYSFESQTHVETTP